MKIKVSVATSKVGSKCEETLELDDDCTEEEIEECAKDAMFQMINWDWQKVS